MMGSGWSPPPYFFSRDSEVTWVQRFAWWPKTSQVSENRIWLTKAWYGYRYVYGPAGEDPVKIEQWLTDEEYMWYQLTRG